MSASVSVINYEMGNLFSVRRALEYCGGKVEFVSDPAHLKSADRVVLPGVGAFGDGISSLKKIGFVDALRDFSSTGRPLLGICLGMQLLFDSSEEFGSHEGLSIVPGKVVRLPAIAKDGAALRIPHVGWSALKLERPSQLLEGAAPGDSVFFVHSYMVTGIAPESVVASSNYGGHDFPAVIQVGAVSGCQFHPEKSGKVGLNIISNFLRA